MLAIVVQLPVAGSHISAARMAPAASLPGLLEPPVTSPLPSGNNVAFTSRRAYVIGLVYCQAGEGALRSMISAVFVGVPPPPTTRILPSSYMADVPAFREPNLRWGPLVHVPVPELSRK